MPTPIKRSLQKTTPTKSSVVSRLKTESNLKSSDLMTPIDSRVADACEALNKMRSSINYANPYNSGTISTSTISPATVTPALTKAIKKTTASNTALPSSLTATSRVALASIPAAPIYLFPPTPASSLRNNDGLLLCSPSPTPYVIGIPSHFQASKVWSASISSLSASSLRSRIHIESFQYKTLPCSIASSPFYLIDIALTRYNVDSNDSMTWGMHVALQQQKFLVIGSLDERHNCLNNPDLNISKHNGIHRGLLVGDVIISVNRRLISSYQGSFVEITKDIQSMQTVHLLIIRCKEGNRKAQTVLNREMETSQYWSSASRELFTSPSYSQILSSHLQQQYEIYNQASLIAVKETFQFLKSSLNYILEDISLLSSSELYPMNYPTTTTKLSTLHKKYIPLLPKPPSSTTTSKTSSSVSSAQIGVIPAAKKRLDPKNYIRQLQRKQKQNQPQLLPKQLPWKRYCHQDLCQKLMKNDSPEQTSTPDHPTLQQSQKQQSNRSKQPSEFRNKTCIPAYTTRKSSSDNPKVIVLSTNKSIIESNSNSHNNNSNYEDVPSNTNIKKFHEHVPESKVTSNQNTVSKPDIRILGNESLKVIPLFDDDEIEYFDNYEDGTRSKLFLNPEIEKDFPAWLSKRRQTWRKRWNIETEHTCEQESEDECIGNKCTIEFWKLNDHQTFQHWLAYSTNKWKRSYSWHKHKRQKLEQEQEEIVHFPCVVMGKVLDNKIIDQWYSWMRVRKNQWRIMRRKWQRRIEEEAAVSEAEGENCKQIRIVEYSDKTIRSKSNNSKCDHKKTLSSSKPLSLSNQKEIITKPNFQPTNNHSSPIASSPMFSTSHLVYIDAHIEDEEKQSSFLKNRPPLDISFLFFPDLGAPDDVISYILSFLHPSEHGNLLCINYETSQAIKERADMWRNMCPAHWILPKRPRKPWHILYISKLREEEEMIRKRSDDVLIKASQILSKGDHLHKLERLVLNAEKSFRFNANYVSAIVLERNSLLNLSVIYQRHRITKWLIEVKNADIETFDRGNFTPLLNAAWAGDRYLVRYLLGKKADRKKVGTAHYSKGLAHPDFKGLTAEGWARKRGFEDLANLIKLGLS